MNQQQMSAKPTNPVLWVVLGIVVLAVAGGIWYAVAQDEGRSSNSNIIANRGSENRSQIIIGNNQQYTSNGISVVVPGGWFLSTELGSNDFLFAISTMRGVTSILALPNRLGVVVQVLKRKGIQKSALAEYFQRQEADFRQRMPGSPSKLEQIQLKGKTYWKWTTDTLTTFEGEGSYGESYFIPLEGNLIEIAVTSYGPKETERYKNDIETMIVSVE